MLEFAATRVVTENVSEVYLFEDVEVDRIIDHNLDRMIRIIAQEETSYLTFASAFVFYYPNVFPGCLFGVKETLRRVEPVKSSVVSVVWLRFLRIPVAIL